MDKVTIKLNIFGSFMEDVIMGNLNKTFVVVVYKSIRRVGENHIL